jgi:hypothetical protein
MSEIKIRQGAVITIELPGLEAIRVDTTARTIAVDSISGIGALDEPSSPPWTVLDFRHGTYGDFHRLRPESECNDPDCINSGQHAAAETAPCGDCGRLIRYLDEDWYAIDSGGVCAPCARARYGDRASEYLIA